MISIVFRKTLPLFSLKYFFRKIDFFFQIEKSILFIFVKYIINQIFPIEDIFISYCWANSLNAKKNNEIGNLFSDPRYINSCIEQYKFSTWLDIKELTSAEKSVGLFEQILKGLKESSVFVPFISDEYAESTNCRYEFQFAIKVLEKKVVPIIVGSGDNWKNTTIGALLASRGIKPIYLQNISQEDHFKEKLTEIIERIKYEFSSNEESNVSNKNAKVPKVGDHVIARYKNHVYYTATVVSYDSVTLEYTVDWDDGDNDERVKSFEHVRSNFISNFIDKCV